MKTLIAGVGYRNLCDLSFGPLLVDALAELEWPEHVQIADLSYGAIAVYQWFLEHEGEFDRAIFVAAAARDRIPGSMHHEAWRGSTEDDDAVQARIGEALTGVISLDNLLVICEHFRVLPAHVSVLELEPLDDGWGPDLSEPVAARVPEAIEILRRETSVTSNVSPFTSVSPFLPREGGRGVRS